MKAKLAECSMRVAELEDENRALKSRARLDRVLDAGPGTPRRLESVPGQSAKRTVRIQLHGTKNHPPPVMLKPSKLPETKDSWRRTQGGPIATPEKAVIYKNPSVS